MLYLFLVELGDMVVMELDNASLSVKELKKLIEAKCQIPISKQVLLISGGEPLESESRVCDYSAGTDTNPIFLFNKLVIESGIVPSLAEIDHESKVDEDIKSQIETNFNMAISLNTLMQRSQLAYIVFERSKQLSEMCEKLVHYQHLQQQGWASVIVNLEDLSSDFAKRKDKFEVVLGEYFSVCENSMESLETFEGNLELLKSIPLLETMMNALAKSEEAVTKPATTNTVNADLRHIDAHGSLSTTTQVINTSNCKTLYDWVLLQNNYETLKKAHNYCQSALEQYEMKFFESVLDRTETILKTANNSEMKEIRGIEDRLFHLEKILSEVKKINNEQIELFQMFVQNKNRIAINNSNDGLPHNITGLLKACDEQMQPLILNYRKLRELRRRCLSAKEEFVANIHQRLKWVMFSEIILSQAERDMALYTESIQKVVKNLQVFYQIQTAPRLYLSAIVETVRRRTFSQAHLLWTTELSCHFSNVYNGEVAVRQKFQNEFEGHFLNILFPGMEEKPSDYGVQPPQMFDVALPSFTNDDIEMLRKQLPALVGDIELPNFDLLVKPFAVVKFDDKLDDFLRKTLFREGEMQLNRTENMTQTSQTSCELENAMEEFEEVPSTYDDTNISVSKTIQVNKELENDNEHLTETNLVQSDAEMSAIKQKLDDLINENVQLRQTNELLQSTVEQLEDKLGQLESSNGEKDRGLMIELQLENLRRECNNKDQKILQLTQRFNSLVKERNYFKDMFDSSKYDEKYMRMSMSSSSSLSYLTSESHVTNPIVNQPRPMLNQFFELASKKISLSCTIGDIVLIVWSPEHMSYIVISDIDTYTFVHPESYSTIGLGKYQLKTNVIPAKLFTFARVVDRETCLTKRSDNRYNIPRESQFYRIKVQKLEGKFDFLNKISDDISLNALIPHIFELPTSFYMSAMAVSTTRPKSPDVMSTSSASPPT